MYTIYIYIYVIRLCKSLEIGVPAVQMFGRLLCKTGDPQILVRMVPARGWFTLYNTHELVRCIIVISTINHSRIVAIIEFSHLYLNLVTIW